MFQPQALGTFCRWRSAGTFRELGELLPEVNRRGIHAQVVTNAFRAIPVQWNGLSLLNIVVSVDGLQAEHDVRRKPATYDRTLKNIAGSKFTMHRTITGQMMERPGYAEKFVRSGVTVKKQRESGSACSLPPARGTGSRNPDTDQPRRFTEELFPLLVAHPLIEMRKG